MKDFEVQSKLHQVFIYEWQFGCNIYLQTYSSCLVTYRQFVASEFNLPAMKSCRLQYPMNPTGVTRRHNVMRQSNKVARSDGRRALWEGYPSNLHLADGAPTRLLPFLWGRCRGAKEPFLWNTINTKQSVKAQRPCWQREIIPAPVVRSSVSDNNDRFFFPWKLD